MHNGIRALEGIDKIRVSKHGKKIWGMITPTLGHDNPDFGA
jgi:hypothetical protein